ncbi:MAG TPA: MFS transporter [Acidobacteriaceae bacterium]|nr:MFS transporter [Acidobacteriaceae bacterium]
MQGTSQTRNAVPSVAGATVALVLLTALNFVNYIDRYVLAGVQEQIKGEFHASDAQLGSLTFFFLLTYMVASPFTGWLGDRFPRKPMIVIAALFWCSVNLLTAYVHSFASLNFRHAALGLGEASFGIFAPAMLADFYPEDQRNRVLTIFNIAVPVGAALGFLTGGYVGEHFGWRMSFTVSAIPGIVIALLIAMMMKEPPRVREAESRKKLERSTVWLLVRNPAYLCIVLGYAAVTFTTGGLSIWMPTFLERLDGRTQSSAAFMMGAITVGGGLLGTIVGGAVAQRWSRKNSAALYLVPAWSALLAFFPALVCFFGPSVLHTKAWTVPALAVAIFLIFLGSGPVNAATVNSVPAGIRATALAGQLLLIHALGDASSPTIIGAISDRSNLAVGLGSTLIALLLASAIFFVGARFAKPLSHSMQTT